MMISYKPIVGLLLIAVGGAGGAIADRHLGTGDRTKYYTLEIYGGHGCLVAAGKGEVITTSKPYSCYGMRGDESAGWYIENAKTKDGGDDISFKNSHIESMKYPGWCIAMGLKLKPCVDDKVKQLWRYSEESTVGQIVNEYSGQCIRGDDPSVIECVDSEQSKNHHVLEWRIGEGDVKEDIRFKKEQERLAEFEKGSISSKKVYQLGAGAEEDSWDYSDECPKCVEWYAIRHCFAAEKLMKGSSFIERLCVSNDGRQRWMFKKGRWRNAAKPKLCVTAPAVIKKGSKLTLEKCASSGLLKKRQKWLLGDSRFRFQNSPNREAKKEAAGGRALRSKFVGPSPKLKPDMCLNGVEYDEDDDKDVYARLGFGCNEEWTLKDVD